MPSLKKLKKFWINKKVYITGHTGFKGSWMLIILNLLGAKLYGFSLKPKKKSLFNQARCYDFLKKNIYADIKNINLLKKNIDNIKPDILFHLAAQPLVSEAFYDPLKTFNTNIIGTLNVLEVLRKNKSIKSVVIITTDKVYRINNFNKSYKETDELGGREPYSISKVCSELITKSYVETFFKEKFLKNKVSTARSGNVIGGGDYSPNRLMPDIIKSKNSKKKLLIRNPNHIRPWQHVIEPTIGYLKLAEEQFKKKLLHKNPSWNFGPTKSNFVKVKEVVNIVQKKHKMKIKFSKKKKFFETDILKLDSSKAKKILNWYPKWNIKKSIENVIEWDDQLKKNKNAKQICENQIKNYFD